jgi:hypothetical protein
MKRILLKVGAVLFGITTLFLCSSFAQSITGAVTDPSGAAVAGAQVEVASPALIEQQRTVTTNDVGRFTFINLEPGMYTVTVKKESFTAARREGVVLTTGFTAQIDLQLMVGAITETVAVQAEAPVVDTQSTTANEVLNTNNMEQLPTNRTLGSFLDLIPGGGTQNFGAPAYRGSTDAQTMIDGARTSILIGAGPGLTSGATSNSAFQEMSFSNGLDNLEMQTPGMFTRIIPKEGGNQFHGGLFATFTNDSFSGNNVNAALAAPPSNLLASVPLRLWDLNPTFGGPIIKGKLWFQGTLQVDSNNFASPRSPANATPGLTFTKGGAVNDPTKAYTGTGNVTYQVDTRDKISFFYQQTSTDEPFTREPSFVFFGLNNAADASANLNTYSKQSIVRWTRIQSARLLFDGTFSIFNDTIANDIAGPYQNWSAQFNNNSNLTRPSPASLMVGNFGAGFIYNQTLSDFNQSKTWTLANSANYVTGSHQFRFGYQFLRGQYYHAQRYVGDAYITAGFGPPTVTEVLPLNSIDKIGGDLGVYAQDKWTIKRMTINYGARFDYLRTRTPNENLPATAFLPAQTFAPKGVVNWRDISPRVGLAYDVFSNHMTVLRAGIAKFVAGQTTNLTDVNNPAALIQNSATFAYLGGSSATIYNPDGSLNKNAIGAPTSNAAATFGTTQQTTFYSPDVISGWGHRGHTWDLEGGISQQILPRVSVTGTAYYIWTANRIATVNTNLNIADYDRFCATAPSDSVLPGGGGYQVCGLANLNPAYLSIPVHNVVSLSTDWGNHNGILNVTNGFQLNTQGSFGRGGFITGGFEYRRIIFDNCATLLVDPTNGGSYFCRSVTPYLPNFRLSGGYTLPGKIMVSTIFKGNKASGGLFATTQQGIGASWGAPFSATTLGRPCTGGFGFGTCTVPLVNPYNNYLEVWTQFDTRFSRPFTIEDRYRLTPEFDFFNIFNQAGISGVSSTYTAATATTPRTWAYPTGIGPIPRQFRFSLQFNF